MRRLKTRVLYHGGSLPVPGYFQKGKLRLEDDVLTFKAKGARAHLNIDLRVPLAAISDVRTEEKKYYSSTAYMLIVAFRKPVGGQESIELEIRSFGRRGRAQALARLWAEILAPA